LLVHAFWFAGKLAAAAFVQASIPLSAKPTRGCPLAQKKRPAGWESLPSPSIAWLWWFFKQLCRSLPTITKQGLIFGAKTPILYFNFSQLRLGDRKGLPSFFVCGTNKGLALCQIIIYIFLTMDIK
jgi:hypothetical protein